MNDNPSDALEGASNDPPVKVLLVDDNPEYRRLARLIIEKDPRLEVTGEAGDGEEAITLSQELKPDIVVLDLSMPLMDGFQAISGIGSASPCSRILICTAFSDLGPDAIDLGADDYISKQVDAREFCERLLDLMSVQRNPGQASGEEWISPYLVVSALKRRTP